jgi:hypothetical protein
LILGGCLIGFGGIDAGAQSPVPPRARRSPAAPRATPAKPAETPAPAKPRTALEQLVAIVKEGKPKDPAGDVSRKLLLARVAAETEDPARAKALLDEVVPVIEGMPKIDPEDKEGKRINFRRSGLRSEWMSVMARLDPVKALRAAVAYGEETNPLHHAGALQAQLRGLDCAVPERKTAVEENVGHLIKPVEEALKARTWSLVHAPQVLATVARAARACGLEPTGATANDLARRSLKVFEDTDLSIRACEMATTAVVTAQPNDLLKAMASVARYQLKPRYKGDEPDLCLGDKLSLAAEMTWDLPVGHPGRQALADLVGTTVNQLNEKTLRFGYCSAASTLSRLTKLNPGAAEKGLGVALTVWRKQDKVESYCDVPVSVARAGRRLAEAGAAPAWSCSVFTTQPEGKPLDEAQNALLRKQRTLAAVELRGLCAEAEGFLQIDRSDVDFLGTVRARQLVLDRTSAEPLVTEDLKALAAADRYAYAMAVLPAFWTKETY